MRLPPIAQPVSFEELLALDEIEPQAKTELRSPRRRLLVPLAVVGALVAAMCVAVPLISSMR